MGKIKKRIKFVYYGLLCQLLGAPNNNSVFRGKLAQMLPGNKNSAVRLIINGKVTKVGFRRWIRNIAAEHNVDCWAKNKSRDTVEVFLVGRKTRVGKVVKAAYQGPKRAVVERVQERWYNKPLSPTQDVRTKYVITFGGDTSLGEYYIGKTKDENLKRRLHKDPYSFFESLEPIVKDSDYLILNFESVLAEAAPASFYPDKQYPNWDHAERTLGVFNKLGVSAVSLANNHTMDFGPTYLLQTRDLFESKGIKCFGAGQNLKEAAAPLELRLKGNRSCQKVFVFSGMRAGKRYREYGFFAEKESPGVFSVGTRMLKAIKECRKKNPDAIIIVTPHWQGCDYKHVSPKIKDKCRALIDAGADYVIGHGPHMLNEIERWGDGLIAYSIGNFVFNSPGRYGKLSVPPYSLVAKLVVMETSSGWTIDMRFYPIITDNKKTDYNVSPITAEMAQKDFPGLTQDSKRNYFFTSESGAKTSIDAGTSLNKLRTFVFSNKKISDKVKAEEFVDAFIDLQKQLDEIFKEAYYLINRSRVICDDSRMLSKLSNFVLREYMSHSLLRKFEKHQIKLARAVSFRDIMIENSEISRMGVPQYVWYLDRKDQAYRFADAIGLRRPRNDGTIYKFDEIPPQTGPIVVKPVQSTGSMGVFLVFDENTILSVREGIYLRSWEELISHAKKQMEDDKRRVNKYFRRDEWMLEELVVGDKEGKIPASDIKFYVCYGDVILVSESNPLFKNQFCYWDKDMNPIDSGRLRPQDTVYDGTGFSREDLEYVREISLKIPAPFVRLDFLKGVNDFVFCEATPRPGNFELFNKKYDRLLGEAYRAAEARILTDLLLGKKFEEFTRLFLTEKS